MAGLQACCYQQQGYYTTARLLRQPWLAGPWQAQRDSVGKWQPQVSPMQGVPLLQQGVPAGSVGAAQANMQFPAGGRNQREVIELSGARRLAAGGKHHSTYVSSQLY